MCLHCESGDCRRLFSCWRETFGMGKVTNQRYEGTRFNYATAGLKRQFRRQTFQVNCILKDANRIANHGVCYAYRRRVMFVCINPMNRKGALATREDVQDSTSHNSTTFAILPLVFSAYYSESCALHADVELIGKPLISGFATERGASAASGNLELSMSGI